LVTISESKKPIIRPRASAQLKYAITYVVITVIVLAFLNLYCAQANQHLFKQSKYASLCEKATLTANEIAATGSVNLISASGVVLRTGGKLPRVIVTDEYCNIIYDTAIASKYSPAVPSELAEALTGEIAFTWDYRNSVITSAVAVPIYIDGLISGSVYMLEVDRSDGALLKSLHINILTITLVLGVFLILFSIFYVRRYSYRLNKIMTSMRIIQDGDYTHKIDMRGNDELHFLADEFNFLTDRLQISEDKRRQFVSDASHELKTPLASIKLLSDSILQYDMDMETVREFAGDIGEEADRLNRMTMKLLALTKDESNTANDESEIIYLSPTVERVVKMLDAIAAKNRIKITMDLHQDMPVLIQEDDLYQITYNLVENGIKYNIPGGTLSISLHRQEDMAVLRVSDTGTGIPPESLEHVFERFYRVDKARSRQTGGSGLGLAIVRSMVERNNGEIHLQSTVGKGTTFTVAFPCFDISEADLPPDIDNSEDME
jgi:signal transduction histidine kinase